MTTETLKPKRRANDAGTPVTVRLQPDLLTYLDAFIKAEPKPITRPEAIRMMLLLNKMINTERK